MKLPGITVGAGAMTQDKCDRGGEVDEESGDSLTQVRGYQATKLSLPSQRDYHQRIHGRYQRAGRPHKTHIVNEFCAICERNGIFLAIATRKHYPGNPIKMIENISLLDLLVARPTAVRFLSVLLGGPRVYGIDLDTGIHATEALTLTNSFAKLSLPTVFAHAGNGVTYAGSYEASA